VAQVVPQVKVLHDCGDPRLGVFVSDERGEAVAQVELGSASRAQRWGQLSSSGDDHPPEGIAPDVCGGGQSLCERLRNRRLSGRHQTGDDQNRRLLKHRARMPERLRHGHSPDCELPSVELGGLHATDEGIPLDRREVVRRSGAVLGIAQPAATVRGDGHLDA